MSPSPMAKVCEKPECKKAYQEDRHQRQLESKRNSAWDSYQAKKKRERIKAQKERTKGILDDVKKAEEMGMSYGQWKALQD